MCFFIVPLTPSIHLNGIFLIILPSIVGHSPRHNVIMETPEARTKSAELHQRLLEEQKRKNPSVEGDEEDEEDEGDADENEDLSSGDDEIQVGGMKHILGFLCLPVDLIFMS